MRVYVGVRGKDCRVATTKSGLARQIEANAIALRRRVIELKGLPIKYKGWTVYEAEVERVQGRGGHRGFG